MGVAVTCVRSGPRAGVTSTDIFGKMFTPSLRKDYKHYKV